METGGNEEEKWLELEVCLMNQDDLGKKTAGTLAADKVHMVQMKIKVDTGCSELALPESLVQQLNLPYIDTVLVSSSTDNNVAIKRYGPVIIYWEGLTYEAKAYGMPSLDSALLGLKPLISMRPDFDWRHNSLKRGIVSYTHKRYHINFNEIEAVIGSDHKVDYFEREHGVKIHITNEGGSKMLLIICAMRLDIDIDQVAQIVSNFAPSLKPV